MAPQAWINSLTFSDDTTVNFSRDDIVVIVGPNNAGKSAALRGMRAKATQRASGALVIKDLALSLEGTEEQLITWLDENAHTSINIPGNPMYNVLGAGFYRTSAVANWRLASTGGLEALSSIFCLLLNADERITAANPAGNIAITREPLQHPIHYLQKNDQLENKISLQFKKAFGVDLIVHRNAGGQVPLLCGIRPTPKSGQDRLSYDYMQELDKLPELSTQGDGMRSFAGILLHTLVGQRSILLIDEPEAFLHPPQAHLIGKMLATDKPSGRQLFIATHSGDVLRGLLDSGSKNIRVIRLKRNGTINPVRELKNDSIALFWNDPLLRYSNILDGLFHEKVIVCEGDSDCRFYAAIGDAIYEIKGENERRPAHMFVHGGGKARMPLIIRSLRELDVPVAAVVDFDVLNDEIPLRLIVEAAGGDWKLISADWKAVKMAIDSKKPELNSNEVKQDIGKILQGIKEQYFPKEARKSIQEILRRSSPWSTAKEGGKSFVPSGDPTKAYSRLIKKLMDIGIFVVEVGQLEGFARNIGGHGPAWVNEVLRKNLKTEPELQAARDFVSLFTA